MTRPTTYLIRMAIFLLLVAAAVGGVGAPPVPQIF
jgi:hypothetical protein